MSSKLCPQSLVPNSGAPKLVRAGCPVVKAVDYAGLLLEAQQQNPDIIGIARFMSPNITAEQLRDMEPVKAALFWVDTFKNKFALNPHVKYVELPNEPVFKLDDGSNDIEAFEWLGEFEKLCVESLASIGLRAVVGNFSTGYPHIAPDNLHAWQAFRPALQAALTHKGLLGIHGYSTVPLKNNFHEILRHRLIHDLFLVPEGLGALPIVYTEFGRLDYKQHVSDAQYAQELIEVDEELRKDSYLLGVTIFTFGSTNQAWDAFDVNETVIPDRLAEHIRNIRDVSPAPPSIPPSSRFKLGDRIEVDVDALNTRHLPAGNVIGVHRLGELGTVVGESKLAKLFGTDVIWWLIDYDTSPDGYVSGGVPGNERYIKAHTVSVPSPLPLPEPTSETLVLDENFTSGFHLQFGPMQDNKWVPTGWIAWFADEHTPRIEGQADSQWWTPPEMMLRDKNHMHFSEIDTMFRDLAGVLVPMLYHVFRGWGRLWFKLWRKVTMQKGIYRLEIRFWPDVLLASRVEHTIIKTPDLNPLNNEFRFIIGRSELDWTLGDQHPSCVYTTMSTQFTHAGGDVELGGEWRYRWGVLVTGVFIQSIKLFRVN